MTEPDETAGPLLRWLDPMARGLVVGEGRTPEDRCRDALSRLRERLREPSPIQWEHDAAIAAFEAMLRHPKEAMEWAKRTR